MEGDLQKTLGRYLKAYRESADLSQEKFADILGVHRTYIGGIERGERNLTLRSVERIAAAINLDPLALISGDPAPATAAGTASSHDVAHPGADMPVVLVDDELARPKDRAGRVAHEP